MMILFRAIFLITFSDAFASDCSAVGPFIPIGQQEVKATISKFRWEQENPIYEDVCIQSTKVSLFDVRGREEEAYNCLKPDPIEVITCKCTLESNAAQIKVIPASWIRTWQPNPLREYRFHAYVVKEADSKFYYDIFARSLSTELASQNIILEGSLKTGPSNPIDGFWIRLEFVK